MRLVEVEKAECQHLHASNYDPDKVVYGKPIQVFGDGQCKCMDCGEMFTPQLPPRRYTVAQLNQLAREYINAARAQWADNDVVDTELQLSLFIAYLAKREQGKESDSGKIST